MIRHCTRIQDQDAFRAAYRNMYRIILPQEPRSTMEDDTNIVKVPANIGFPNMSNVTHNTVFEAFIEADRAMKELPAIREELAQVKANHQTLIDINDNTMAKLSARETELEMLRASLAQREAELAHATFRADAVEAKHRALRSILGGDDGRVVAMDGALEVQQGSNEVSPKPVDDTIEPVTSSSGQSEVNPTVDSTENTQQTAPSNTVESEATARHISSGETAPKPIDESQSESGSRLGTLSTLFDKGSVLVGEDHPTTSLGSDASSTSPSASTSDIQRGRVLESAETSMDSSHSPSLPFSGRLYTSKPDGMEWGYWIVNGGEPAYWMGPATVQELKARYAQWAGHAKADDLNPAAAE